MLLANCHTKLNDRVGIFFLINFVLFQCWSLCAKATVTAVDYIDIENPVNPDYEKIQLKLHVSTMVKQEFLVSSRLTWSAIDGAELRNCFVSWDVFGGGIMGNLLSDAYTVELSLWPNTKYRAKVMCNNKVN